MVRLGVPAVSNDPWHRLIELEKAGASEAWERASLVVALIEQQWSTRDIAARGREEGLRSVASQGAVVRLAGWHGLITAAAGVIPAGITLSEWSVRPVTTAGLPLDAQIRALATGLADGTLDAPRLVRAVHAERAKLAHLWDDDQQGRQATAEEGESVLANQQTDLGLIAWARSTDRFVAIDRGTKWGNPFVLGEDGDRAVVIELYQAHYLSQKPSLWRDLDSLLDGKVLGCWCYPEACHGERILLMANGVRLHGE
jgi:hypothetical protein